jgi:hypothetical protein
MGSGPSTQKRPTTLATQFKASIGGALYIHILSSIFSFFFYFYYYNVPTTRTPTCDPNATQT